MEVISNIALISINETLFVQLISFLILMVLMNRIMFRPLRETMNNRRDYMQKLESDILNADKELKDITQQLKSRTSKVRHEAFSLKEKLEESGTHEADQIFASTQKEIENLREKTRKDVEAQVSEARKYLKTESEVLAVSVMEKILNRRLVS
jgi:F-type H+-transporting ATPase subunit b